MDEKRNERQQEPTRAVEDDEKALVAVRHDRFNQCPNELQFNLGLLTAIRGNGGGGRPGVRRGRGIALG